VRLTILNSDRIVRQRLGRAPWRVTFRLHLRSAEDLAALDAMQGERTTLWYRWGMTGGAGGVHERILGVDYLRLDDTVLVEMSERVLQIGGGAECTATFERDYVAAEGRVFGPYPPAPDPEG
jgi:hypothetical protein